MFNADQAGSLVRSLVIGLGAFFVGKGWVTTEQVAEYGGAAAVVAGAVWGVWFHAGAKKKDLAKAVVGVLPVAKEEVVVEQAAKIAGV